MLHLSVKYSETMMTRLTNFKRFLEVYNLKIVSQDINTQATIELTVNANIAAEAKQVANLAYDFFGDSVLAIRNELQTYSFDNTTQLR